MRELEDLYETVNKLVDISGMHQQVFERILQQLMKNLKLSAALYKLANISVKQLVKQQEQINKLEQELEQLKTKMEVLIQ